MPLLCPNTLQISASGLKRPCRIAVVKQDCCTDLYIEQKNADPISLLLSSQLRIGPVALFSSYKSDFIITKAALYDDLTFYAYQNQLRLTTLQLEMLRHGRSEHIFKHLDCISHANHSDFAIDELSVDWSIYDIVFCLNVSVSLTTRLKNPHVFWALIPLDCSFPPASIGFDAYITHRFASSPVPQRRSLQLPYTIVFSSTLSSFLPQLPSSLFCNVPEDGIYIEINSSGTRPPTLDSIPHIEKLIRLGLPVSVHPNRIDKHLALLLKSKYFIKTGGRPVNANSFAEAISASCLVLCCHGDNFSDLVLPHQCLFTSVDELIEYVSILEKNPTLYAKLLFAQKAILDSQVSYGFQQLSALFERKHRAPNSCNHLSSFASEMLYRASFLLYKNFRWARVQPSSYFW